MPKEIIIIESGATKSDWHILSSDGRKLNQFHHPGMNVSTMDIKDVKSILAEGILSGRLEDASGLYMYTAGVVTQEISSTLKKQISEISGIADIDIQNDLMGAARCVCGKNPGIAAIIGTGSNTCFYDGNTTSQMVYSGGYVIGDEGSAATLGKLFLTDFIKGIVPETVARDFSEKFDASYEGIVNGVYRSISPSRYLGSLAPFILSHYSHPYIKTMVEGNFQRFIDRSLLRYDTQRFPVGIVGGFGWACREILNPLCEKAGIRISGFMKNPVEGLCRYHTSDF